MNIRRLVLLEIVHRKINFGLAVLSVVLAAALVVGGMTLLRGHRLHTGELVAEKKAVVKERTDALKDAMRRITKRMGFNVVIMPKGQNLDDQFADDYAAKTMPEEYADRLANSRLVTVNHLLPALERRVKWPERNNRVLFLVGIKGQVPIAHRDPRKPIMQPVPKDGIILGSALAEMENLAVGDTVRFRGHELNVVKVNSRLGDKRDLTAWIDLKLMQELHGQQGKINTIWALECSCALADVGKVREELGAILPNVQIEEQGEKALARAEARKAAADTAKKALDEEEAAAAKLKRLDRRFRLFVSPLIVVCSGLWIGLLALGNARDRRYEVGVLRAIGVRSRQILSAFLSRALLIGLLGAGLGYALGFALGTGVFSLSAIELRGESPSLFDGRVLAAVLVSAPLLSALACWLPAVAASMQDPAVVLRDE